MACLTGGQGRQDGEQHDADAVVEETLAGDLGLECLGDLRLSEDPEHGNRVSR